VLTHLDRLAMDDAVRAAATGKTVTAFVTYDRRLFGFANDIGPPPPPRAAERRQ